MLYYDVCGNLNNSLKKIFPDLHQGFARFYSVRVNGVVSSGSSDYVYVHGARLFQKALSNSP